MERSASTTTAIRGSTAILTMTDEEILRWKEGVDTENGVITLWSGLTVTEETVGDVVDFFKDKLETRITPIGVVVTLPDAEHRDMENPESGGRHDFFFVVDGRDVTKFAPRRFGLQDPPRWWEDVFFNNQEDIYPMEFREAYPNPV